MEGDKGDPGLKGIPGPIGPPGRNVICLIIPTYSYHNNTIRELTEKMVKKETKDLKEEEANQDHL